MKKTLITAGIVIGIIVIPIIAMAIPITRSLLLGLTPEEQILMLADEIDKQRATVDETATKQDNIDQQMQSMTAKIEEQQQTIVEQQKIIDENKAKVENTADCQKILAEKPMCGFQRYQSQQELDKYIKQAEDNKESIKGLSDNYDKCSDYRARCL